MESERLYEELPKTRVPEILAFFKRGAAPEIVYRDEEAFTAAAERGDWDYVRFVEQMATAPAHEGAVTVRDLLLHSRQFCERVLSADPSVVEGFVAKYGSFIKESPYLEDAASAAGARVADARAFARIDMALDMGRSQLYFAALGAARAGNADTLRYILHAGAFTRRELVDILTHCTPFAAETVQAHMDARQQDHFCVCCGWR